MLAHITALIRKDLKTGTRDQIMAYMLLSPLLLGALAALLVPLIEHTPLMFAVSSDLAAEHVDALREHGRVERLPDRAAVIARVGLRDDVAGVAASSDPAKPEVIVQGDEILAIGDIAGSILDYAAHIRDGQPVNAVTIESLGQTTPSVRLIAAALLAYSVVVMVGLLLGFTILEERMTGVDAVLAVSPLSSLGYAAATLLLGTVLSLALVAPPLLMVLGLDLLVHDSVSATLGAIADLLLVTLACLPFALSLGLAVGAWAKDQLGAITIMKALLPVWLTLPIAGFVVPSAWQWVLWPLANHWGVQAYFEFVQGGAHAGATWRAAGLALVAGLPVLAATLYALRQKLGFASSSA